MFNLITSIIAVALTAALALAEITYVGPAFTSSQPKAVAAQIIASMSQIDAAWLMWGTTNTTTTTTPTITGAGNVNDLLGVAGQTTTQYLASLPPAPATAATWSAAGTLLAAGYQLDLVSGAAPETTEMGVFVVLDSTSLGICTEIARDAGQVSPTGTLAAPGAGKPTLLVTAAGAGAGQFSTAFTGYKFGCVAFTGAAGALGFGAAAGATSSAVAADIPAAGVTQKYIAYFKQ